MAWPIFWLTEASLSTPVRRAPVSAFCSSRPLSSPAAACTSDLVSAGIRSSLSRMNFSVW